MPATRKSSRLSGGAGGKQSTLSFHHKVTKSVPKSSKDAITKPSIPPKDVVLEPTQEEPAVEEVPAVQVEETEAIVPEKTDLEHKAEKISAKKIERYWSKIDGARSAMTTHKKHTAGLTTGEKVLRYFDVSSQFGVSYYALAFFVEMATWLTVSCSRALESPGSSGGSGQRNWD